MKKSSGGEKLDILYEDASLIVIDKPSGLLSLPYPGSSARTVAGMLERIMRSKGVYANITGLLPYIGLTATHPALCCLH